MLPKSGHMFISPKPMVHVLAQRRSNGRLFEEVDLNLPDRWFCRLDLGEAWRDHRWSVDGEQATVDHSRSSEEGAQIDLGLPAQSGLVLRRPGP